jgi:hypothetical protein
VATTISSQGGVGLDHSMEYLSTDGFEMGLSSASSSMCGLSVEASHVYNLYSLERTGGTCTTVIFTGS